MSVIVDTKTFEDLMSNKLAKDEYEKASRLFKSYGENLSFDFANVLIHAIDQGPELVKKVLDMLQAHFDEYLCYQHPDARGVLRDGFGVNPTAKMFLSLCTDVLKLKPNEPEQKELPF